MKPDAGDVQTARWGWRVRSRSVEDPPREADDADLWPADQAYRLFAADLEMLGMRIRRGHDLRRTFITLAQEDGARRDVLQVITHAPDANDVMSLYTLHHVPMADAVLGAGEASDRAARDEPDAER